MNLNKADFSKILFFGVKRKKNSNPNVSNLIECSELRLRVLPDEDFGNDIVEEGNDDFDETSAVKLFSAISSKMKSKPKHFGKLRNERYVS